MIDFPANPTVGQVFTSGSQSWTYDGTKWVASGVYVGPPQFSNDNRIINGDMRIDQRNNGASGTAIGYTVDRWQYVATQGGKIQWNRASTGPINLGFPYCLVCSALSAYTPLTTDAFFLGQVIEADMVSDFAWGTANAYPVTLSFWVVTSLSGNFSGTLTNAGTATRSYPFTFSIPTASTWTKVAITIPGDTTGTWVLNGVSGGVWLNFDLGSGANYRGPANAWGNGNWVGATGAVNTVATNGASFIVTGVKLEIGSVATPFNRQSLAKSMADCQRYYQAFPYFSVNGYNSTTGAIYGLFPFPVTMRASPTIAFVSPSYINTSGMGVNTVNSTALSAYALVTATGVAQGQGAMTASAEL